VRGAVVGAGAAGLIAAIPAANVTLLNAHPRIGLKILMSGSTRWNVTHRQVNELVYRLAMGCTFPLRGPSAGEHHPHPNIRERG